MFTSIFLNLIHNIWPMLFIFTVIIVGVRLAYLIYNKENFVFYKELLMLCFILYILLLYYIVTFQDNNYGTNNFVPFKEIFRYSVSSKFFFKNVLGNILLFAPFGIFVTYYTKAEKIYVPVTLSIIVSIAIEFAQSKIGRTVDIDDIILNVIGGIIGYLIYKFGKKLTSKLPAFMKSELFLDILFLSIIVTIIYLSFKFNFWRYLVWTM